MEFPKRGEVYWVDLDPTRGAEIQKKRPAVVIQNDIGNRHSLVTIVATIASSVPERLGPYQIMLKPPEGGLKQDSVVLLNQLHTIDKSIIINNVGNLSATTMDSIDRALIISLGIRV